jgi:hypothetical protein
MRRLVVMALVLGSVSLSSLATSGPAAAAEPEHDVVVSSLSGAPLTTWPDFDPGVDRFAVTSSQSADGLSVRATSSDPAARIIVNGRPASNGQRLDVPGLTPGDEVNVQISDEAGTSNQAWIYLPRGFPTIETTSDGEGPEPGLTAVTLRAVTGTSYATLVDERGVPAQVLTHELGTSDLSLQPNGHYSLAVAMSEALFGDHVIEEYDESFQKVATHRMVGHPRTDFHDSILLPGGGRILMAYIQAQDGQTDSWLQEVSPTGEVLLDWNSREHVDRINDPILNALGDYAHLNSMQVMKDGNLLASFRHLNQVLKIDRQTGDVIWRLGGRRSDFTFGDDPLGGPCAQHTARELPSGEIQIFDNGSSFGPSPSQALCPDPDNPGDEVYRPYSRVVVYDLDADTDEAHLVQSHEVGAFSQFAGSAQRLGAGTLDDHVLVGLNNAQQLDPPAYGPGEAPDAVELAADGSPVWTLTSTGFATYRATRVDAPDRSSPRVSISSPIDGAVVEEGARLTADFGCSDTGGSNLVDCEGSVAQGVALPTGVGTHQLVVRATDGDGNATSRTVTYRVAAPATTTPPSSTTSARADALIRRPGARWVGRDTYSVKQQTVSPRIAAGSRARASIKVRNSGDASARFTLTGQFSHRRASGRWYAGDRDVTRAVLAGEYRTTQLAPGETVRLRLVVPVPSSFRPTRTVLRLSARAPGGGAPDVVRVRLRVS